MSLIATEYLNGKTIATLNLDETLLFKKYDMQFNICDNAACSCGEVHIALIGSTEHRNVSEFTVDVFRKERTDKNVDQPNNDLVENIINKFDKNDWKTLFKIFSEYKLSITENLDFLRTSAKFLRSQDIEMHGELTAYSEILPHGAKFTLGEIENEISCTLLDEQYCLIRGCTCTNVTVVFLSIRDGVQQEETPPLVKVSYRTGEAEIIDLGSSTKENALEIWSQFKRKYPNILKVFSKRHQQLSKLYENYRLVPFFPSTPVVNSTKTPGRNDPCSCGSGKKYKKCCIINPAESILI